MRIARPMVAAAVACAALTMGAVLAGGKEEPKPSVKFARTWEGAVAEAKTLVVPIVMHNHGFYCGPCWGMHASVLKNDKYIEYSDDNTVEVIAEQDLQKGVDEGKDKRAEMYDAKDEKGNPVKYMMEWPGLTLEEMLALHASPASTYNHTGGIPYTSIIDPFTLQEIKGLPAGGHSVKEIIAECDAAKAQLNKEHGPSVKRSTLKKVRSGVRDVETTLAGKGGAAKALADLRKLQASIAKEPESIRNETKAIEEKILDAAKTQLDDAEAKIAAGDVRAAQTILNQLGSSLKGTDLESRVKELADKIKAAQPAT